jgi:hypothetical protein
VKADLLLKLAEHLETGKLGHEVFNYHVVNGGALGEQLYDNGCGSCGCALGELPYAFPEDFKWKDGWPCRIDDPNPDVPLSYEANKFFQITERECQHLFCGQMLPGFGRLGPQPTKEQVAANIRAFVAKRQTS